MPRLSKTINVADASKSAVEEESPFLSVSEAAQIMKSTPETLYVYLCDTGARGGKAKRPRFPKDLYVKIGRKTLFLKDRLIAWIMNGAQFEGGAV